MVWIIIVVVAVVIMYIVNNKYKVDVIEESEKELVGKMEQLMFYDRNSRESIDKLSHDIFILCLKQSNKNVSFDEISSADFLVRNPSLSLSYTGLYKSLKETLQLAGKISKSFQVSDKNQTAKNSLKEVMDSIISQINKM